MPPDRTRPDDPHRARLNPLHSTDLHPPPSSARLPYDSYQQIGQPQQVSPVTSTASVARPAHSLGRGRACRRCRSRKVKCDGRQQPMCGPCETLALRTGQDLSSVVCDFDTEEERKKPVGGGKVAALEAKISALEARIQELTEGKEEPMGPSPSYHDAYSPASSAASLSSTALSAQPPFPSQPHLAQASPYQAASLPPSLDQAYSPGAAYPPPLTPRSTSFPSLPAQAFAPSPAFPPPSTFPQGPAFPAPRVVDPFYPPFSVLPPAAGLVPPPIPAIPAIPVLPLATTPNFPSPPPSATGMRGLPSWPTLRRLINTFFDYPHEAVDLINRRRFMAGFDRSPDDPEFPSECLLHAMVATASDLIGEEAAFEGEERYWTEGTSPTLWHADQADRLIPHCFRKDPNLLQVAQAAVLFSATNLAHGRFLRSYLETSAAVRICVGLGLNHAGSDQRDLPLTALASGRLSLGPPEDDEDVYERAITFWFAYTVEIVTGVASGYACCLDERDVTTLLPAAAPYKNDPTARESLYLHSPNFFTSNPPDLIRLVQINLKSMVLMNRVVSFVHRTSALLDAASDSSSMTGQLDHAKIRASPAFQKLEAALEAFQRRTPNQLVALLEPQAFLTPALTSTSVILLHEFLTTGEEECPSMAKCSEAASVLLQNMHVMNSASFHQRHIPPFLSLCYLVCGRTLVREIALRQARLGNVVKDDIARLRGNVESVIERLKASRTPLGPICATSLSALLSKPDIALPLSSSVSSSPSSGGLPPIMQLLNLTRQRGATYEALCA